jgi:hypothetical protein
MDAHAMADSEQIADDRIARGFGCELWVYPPDRTGKTSYATDEVMIFLESKTEFEVEDEVHHLPPSEELFIQAGEVYSARNIGSRTARWPYGYEAAHEG